MLLARDPTPADKPRRHRRLAVAMVLANIAVVALLALLVVAVLMQSRRAHETRARDTAEAMAAIAQENVESELFRVDAIMRSALDELAAANQRAAADDATVNRILAEHQRLLPGAEALRLTDVNGAVRWGNALPPGRPVDVSDRPYFQRAREDNAPVPLLAGPLRSRVSGHWVMAVVRPVRLQGRFAGVLYATIAVDHFQKLFERYTLSPGDSMTLRAGQLELVAHRVGVDDTPPEVGSTKVSDELRAAVAADPLRGSRVARNPADGVLRTLAYRRLDGWPLTVLVGLDQTRYLAPWHQQALFVSSLAVLAALLILAASLAMYRAWQLERRGVAALAASNRRIQALLRTAGDGIHIVNDKGELLAMSDSFAQMLGSSPEQLKGRHISSWDANQDHGRINRWLEKVRDGDKQRVQVQHRHADGHLLDIDLQIGVANIDGERLIIGSTRDVTERNQLLRRLEESAATTAKLLHEQNAMLDNDLVAIVKLQGRTVVWGNRALQRLFGYAPEEFVGQSTRLVYPDDATYEAFDQQAHAELSQGRHFRGQCRMRHKDGGLLWIDVSGVNLGEQMSFWMLVDITAMKESHANVEHLAYHDTVTQLPNRHLLRQRLSRDLAHAEKTHTQTAVCYLDLDGFKQVNDEHGHDTGDALLAEIGRRLLASLRTHDTAARVGGDEFVLVLTQLARPGDCEPILERLLASIHRPIQLADGTPLTVGASIGVALFPRDATEADPLTELADHAMLRAKRAGKGRIEFNCAGQTTEP